MHDYEDENENDLLTNELEMASKSWRPAYKELEHNVRVYSTKQPKKWGTIDMETLPPIKWLVRELGLRPGPVSILSGFSGAGKSYFVSGLALSVAHGLPSFLGCAIKDSGEVLHLDWDSDEETNQLYYSRVANGFGLPTYNNMKNISYMKPDFSLDDTYAKKLMLDMLRGYKLCVIDCLAASIPKTDIMDERVRGPIDMLNAISSETGCVIVLLHHEPKSTAGTSNLKRVKGSGAIISAAGGSIHLTNENDTITLELGKVRLTKKYRLQYTIDDHGENVSNVDLSREVKLNIIKTNIDMLRDRELAVPLLQLIQNEPDIRTLDINKKINGKAERRSAALAKLVSDGLILKDDRKDGHHYTITDAGKAFMEQEVDL